MCTVQSGYGQIIILYQRHFSCVQSFLGKRIRDMIPEIKYSWVIFQEHDIPIVLPELKYYRGNLVGTSWAAGKTKTSSARQGLPCPGQRWTKLEQLDGLSDVHSIFQSGWTNRHHRSFEGPSLTRWAPSDQVHLLVCAGLLLVCPVMCLVCIPSWGCTHKHIKYQSHLIFQYELIECMYLLKSCFLARKLFMTPASPLFGLHSH